MKHKNLIPIILVFGLVVSDICNFQVFGQETEEVNVNEAEAATVDDAVDDTVEADTDDEVVGQMPESLEETSDNNDMVGGSTGGCFVTEDDINIDEYESNQTTSSIVKQAAIPSSYRNTKLSPIRNQNPYGTCWAFSSLGLAEADLLSDGVSSIDLSELHLAYYTYHTINDPLGGLAGDSNYVNSNSYNYLTLGGDFEQAMFTLLTWTGVAEESSADYSMCETSLSSGVDDSRAYSSVAHLQDAYIVNINKNPDEAKSLIMAHGAVGTSYCEVSSYYDSNHNSYYTGGKYSENYANHAIIIVGWDDSFSKNNFTGSKKPASDGAWLVRNSWGTNSDCHNGYFWLSYCETSLVSAAYSYDMAYTGSSSYYDNNYQYDGGFNGTNVYLSNVNSVQMANIFTASACASGEKLKAVGAYFALTNVSYKIRIYKNLFDTSVPTHGLLALEQEGTTSYKGYYTIPLSSELDLTYGERYSVVIEMYNPSGENTSFAIPIEGAASWNGIWTSNTSASAGQSFYGYNVISGVTRWSDITNSYKGNIRIKAYTNNNGASCLGDNYTVTYELDGAVQNPANAISYSAGETKNLYNPVKKDETFYGWYTDSEFKNKVTSIAADSNQSLTLYAKWKDVKAEDVGLDAPSIKSVSFGSKYALIKWSSVDAAEGYYIYRKSGSGKWKQVTKIGTNKTTTFYDTSSLTNGKKYKYKVVAYLKLEENEITNSSKAKTTYYLKTPSIKSSKKKNAVLTLTLKKNKKATGYQMQYNTKNSFKKVKTYTFKVTSTKLSKLKKGKTYYIRIRCYKKDGSKKYYGAWKTFQYVNTK